MALGKHNVRVRALAEQIARELGNALVAPVIAYVPEGSVDPPTAHMRFPGTITVPDATFEQVLESAARSFKLARLSRHRVPRRPRRLPEGRAGRRGPPRTANGRRRPCACTRSSSTTARRRPLRRRAARRAAIAPTRSARTPALPTRRSRWRSMPRWCAPTSLARRQARRQRRRLRRSAPAKRRAGTIGRRRDRRGDRRGHPESRPRAADRVEPAHPHTPSSSTSIRTTFVKQIRRSPLHRAVAALVAAALAVSALPRALAQRAAHRARRRSRPCPACRRCRTPPTSTAKPRRAS